MTVSSLAHRARVRHAGEARDLDAAERAAAAFMRSLGVEPDDPDRPDLARTPRRLAEAYAELLSPTEFDFTTFANAERYDELVLVRDIPVQSVCEHHLLPFVGQRPRRLPTGRADRRAVQARPHRRPLRAPAADPGTARPPRSRPGSRTGSNHAVSAW